MSANVLKDALQLILSRRVFSDLEIEFLSSRVGLGGVITGLVFGSMLAGVGRYLLEQSVHPQRSWGFGIVKERNHVLCFMLLIR